MSRSAKQSSAQNYKLWPWIPSDKTNLSKCIHHFNFRKMCVTGQNLEVVVCPSTTYHCLPALLPKNCIMDLWHKSVTWSIPWNFGYVCLSSINHLDHSWGLSNTTFNFGRHLLDVPPKWQVLLDRPHEVLDNYIDLRSINNHDHSWGWLSSNIFHVGSLSNESNYLIEIKTYSKGLRSI